MQNLTIEDIGNLTAEDLEKYSGEDLEIIKTIQNGLNLQKDMAKVQRAYEGLRSDDPVERARCMKMFNDDEWLSVEYDDEEQN